MTKEQVTYNRKQLFSNEKNIYSSFCFFCFFKNISTAQTDTLSLSLSEIIALAQSDAPDALLAETRVKNRYWAYQSTDGRFQTCD